MSIVTPCFNAAAWVREAIESVLNQSYEDYEMILIDDGSTDGTWDVISQFKDSRIQAIRQVNKGAAAARNSALAISTGRFIQFLDADDLLSPNKIDSQMADIAQAGPRWVAAGNWIPFHAVPPAIQPPTATATRHISGIDWLVEAWNTGAMMPPHAWLVPRVVADAAGPWDGTCGINDDGEYFCRILLAADGVVESSASQVFYRKANPGSYSQRRDHRSSESIICSYELYARHVLAIEDSHRTRCAIASLALGFQYLAYPEFPDLVERARALVKTLGFEHVRPHGGGRASLLLGNLVGWRASRRLGMLIRQNLLRVNRIRADTNFVFQAPIRPTMRLPGNSGAHL